MTEIELSPADKKMLLVVYRDGKAPHRDKFDPLSARARAKVAREWDVDPDTLSDWCEQARIHGGAKKFTLSAPKPAESSSFFTRTIGGDRVEHKLDASQFVKTVVPFLAGDTLAEWGDADALCCLDVDYHDTAAPSQEWLETMILTRLAPQPIVWHFSKSGGLHLFYLPAGNFTAEELAACAALRFRSFDRAAGLELKTVVFGPGPRKVHTTKDQDTAAGLVEWMGTPEFDEDQRDEWLDTHNMECGKRYEHDHCPIDPSPGAERQPVLISEAGIYCFRCSGKGLAFGSRRPGYAPWPAILGAPSAGELGALVRNAVHWGHAKWVLVERYGIPAPLARLAYCAAVKAYHDELPAGVFDKRTDELARVNNLWLTIDSSYAYPKDIQPLIACLPQAQYVGPDGERKVDPAMVVELNQRKDLSRLGYKSMNVVHGFKMASVFLPDPGQTTVAAPNAALKALTTRGLPRYVQKSKRMPMDEAWGMLDVVAPRIDRTLVKVLLASFACAQETRAGLHPIMFVSGITAAGKTATTQIACGILGARVGNETTFDPDPARFRAAIYTGSQEGPVVVLNELLKDSQRGRFKLSPRDALDFVLNLTPNSASHLLYLGPVKMGRLPSIVITETVCPPTLRDESQLARRIRHYQVNGAKTEWRSTIAKAGITDLHLIRTVSDAMARACDAILSDVIDEHFSVPSTWDEIAESLGVHTIEHDEEFEDQVPWLRELFRLVCVAPALSDKEAKMYAGGYKRVERSDDVDLTAVYTKFADGTGADWATSRRLMEKDWAKILGAHEVVHLDIRGSGGTIYLRFREGPAKTPTKVNGQIVDPSTWESML